MSIQPCMKVVKVIVYFPSFYIGPVQIKQILFCYVENIY